jgi:hypothetical protein
MIRSLLVAFDVAYGRLLMWKWEREFEASKRRMIGCKHERTVKVDLSGGSGFVTDKCLNCWAIRAFFSPNATQLEWTPNSSPPSPKVTE